MSCRQGSTLGLVLTQCSHWVVLNRIATNEELKNYLIGVEESLFGSDSTVAESDFRSFYRFLFPFLKDEGQKSLGGDMAIAAWSLSIARKYPIAQSFVDFVSVGWIDQSSLYSI